MDPVEVEVFTQTPLVEMNIKRDCIVLQVGGIKHVYHLTSLHSWVKEKRRCPYTNLNFSRSQLRRIRFVYRQRKTELVLLDILPVYFLIVSLGLTFRLGNIPILCLLYMSFTQLTRLCMFSFQ